MDSRHFTVLATKKHSTEIISLNAPIKKAIERGPNEFAKQIMMYMTPGDKMSFHYDSGMTLHIHCFSMEQKG